MAKAYYKRLIIIPEARSFSDIEGNSGVEFDAGDNGSQEDKMVSALEADLLILHALLKLNDRQKIIFLYQVLREAGYNLSHEDCAQTLGVKKDWYLEMLASVKKRAGKALQRTQK